MDLFAGVLLNKSNPCVRFKHLEDNENLIEFDAVETSSPVMPKSISSWISRVRSRFSQEVQIELQERSTAEACREAIRIKELRSDSEIINPAQLAYDNSALCLGDDISKWEIEAPKYSNETSLQQPGTSDMSNKVCHSDISTPSSIDLEWENENDEIMDFDVNEKPKPADTVVVWILFYKFVEVSNECTVIDECENKVLQGLSPLTHIPSNVDTTSDTASCLSQLSTPTSNEDDELEWDGHFTSTHISNLDVENDELLREIDCLATDIGENDDR